MSDNEVEIVYPSFVFNMIRVNRLGQKISDDVVHISTSRLEWSGDSAHNPRAKDRDDRMNVWVRVSLTHESTNNTDPWSWKRMEQDEITKLRETGEWSKWFNWDDRLELFEILHTINPLAKKPELI